MSVLLNMLSSVVNGNLTVEFCDQSTSTCRKGLQLGHFTAECKIQDIGPDQMHRELELASQRRGYFAANCSHTLKRVSKPIWGS